MRFFESDSDLGVARDILQQASRNVQGPSQDSIIVGDTSYKKRV